VRVEAWLDGILGTSMALFRRGHLVAWTSSAKLQAWPEHTGAACLRRVFHHPDVEPALHAIGAALQYHGLAAPEWIVTQQGGLAFIENNPRATNLILHDKFDDMDFGAAFRDFAGLSRYERPAPHMGEGAVVHMFPQHIARCVQARDVRSLAGWLSPTANRDIVWSDPGLLYKGVREIGRHCVAYARTLLPRR
jgi:hypothetical protein